MNHHFSSPRVVYSILFYILLVTLIYITKPGIAFDQATGSIKPFGVGIGKTPFSMGTFVSVTAIGCFYVFTILDICLG